MRRILVALLVLALAVSAAAGAAAVYLVRRPFPQISGTLTVPGLGERVEIIRDRWGIPHIYARSARDLFFAQGFVHAQDRLWQMELNRRTASGRLSEIFGEAALPTDRFLRTIGLYRAAASHLAAVDPGVRANLEAYAEGVNAFVKWARGRLPIEFLILRFSPDPWTPADSLSYAKLMAWILGGDWRAEVLRQHLVARFGEGALERLMPDYPADAPVIVPEAVGTASPAQPRKAGAASPAQPRRAAPALPAEWAWARHLPGRPAAGALRSGPTRFQHLPWQAGDVSRQPDEQEGHDPEFRHLPWQAGDASGGGGVGAAGLGSNNWVVAGDRTVTGSPLLANDPHLEAQMPAIWYLMHLNGGGYDVAGATFPGAPGVIIGHNRDIAWGVTNANPDVQDLYIERFHPDDPTRYLYRGQWMAAQVIREEIRVKGRAEPAVEKVRITRHGPVINNVVKGLGATLAIRWTALESSSIIEALDGINRASTWEEFRQALRAWDAPAQNFVFAHRNGEIGYQLPGRIPIRAAGNGALPQPGWTGEHEWNGTVPFDALPSVHRTSGFIVTANNRIAPPGYKHFLGREWDPGFRARRIVEMLGTDKHTAETFARIQADVTSLPARAVIEALRQVQISDPALRPIFAEMLEWDGTLAASSRPAAVYQAFVDSLVRELFRGPLDEEVFNRYLRNYGGPVLTVLALLREPTSAWWPGGRDKAVEEALRQAVRTLEKRLGTDRGTWRWGRLHQPRFTHPIGRIKALAWIFNTTPPETGGDGFTVNNGHFNPEEPFRQVVVASYRQILDPSDWDRSLVIHTTGQSGLPFHRHYRDFAPLWARGEYVPLLFSRPRVEEAAAGRLVLTPR